MSKLNPALSRAICRVGGHYIAVKPVGSDCAYIDGLHCVTLDCPERECIKRDMGVSSTSNRVFAGPYSDPRNQDVYPIHKIRTERHTIAVYGYVDYLVSPEAREELADLFLMNEDADRYQIISDTPGTYQISYGATLADAMTRARIRADVGNRWVRNAKIYQDCEDEDGFQVWERIYLFDAVQLPRWNGSRSTCSTLSNCPA